MFKKTLSRGEEFEKTITVKYKDTAAAYGSGNVEVLATPAMISLMEGTALEGVQPFLANDYTTVGTDICVKHVKATPVGMKVTCKAVLKDVEGARLSFDVEVRDEEGITGYGTHQRFIVHLPEFMAKVGKKK
jgi:fluoroacetyl-CoA thioesterase